MPAAPLTDPAHRDTWTREPQIFFPLRGAESDSDHAPAYEGVAMNPVRFSTFAALRHRNFRLFYYWPDDLPHRLLDAVRGL